MIIYGLFLSPENFYNSKIERFVKKSNVTILQYKQNIWKGNYKYQVEQGIFKKW